MSQQHNDEMHPSCGGALSTLCQVTRRSRVIAVIIGNLHGASECDCVRSSCSLRSHSFAAVTPFRESLTLHGLMTLITRTLLSSPEKDILPSRSRTAKHCIAFERYTPLQAGSPTSEQFPQTLDNAPSQLHTKMKCCVDSLLRWEGFGNTDRMTK